MSNLSSHHEQEKLSGHKNSLKKVLKRTGHNDGSGLPDTRTFEDRLEGLVRTKAKSSELVVHETDLFECESRFVLTKRNDSVMLDQKEPARKKKGSAILASIAEHTEPADDDFPDDS